MKCKSLTAIFALVLALSIQNCSHSGKATVRLNLGLPEKYAVTQKPTLLERVFSLFEVRAYAAAPSGVTGINVQVSGSDMDTISKDFIPADSISIEVPAGSARKIDVVASISPSDPGAVLSFSGSASVDLTVGETKDVDITMAISETKIVIPDYQNASVVQINDMNGNGWRRINIANITGLSPSLISFNPQDIAFDAQGRIYVLNDTSTGLDHAIIRITSIIDPAVGNTTAESILKRPVGASIYYQAIAIDMKKAILYYVATIPTPDLYSIGLDGGTPVSYGLPGLIGYFGGEKICGLSVDENGFVYIALNNHGGNNKIIRFDPTGVQAMKIFDLNIKYGNQNNAPYDVVYKSRNIYVAVAAYVLPYQKILQLNADMQFVTEYGSGIGTESPVPGNFYGPFRFVAKLNRKICIIDDGGLVNSGSYLDRLVAMDDMNGNGWEIYGSNGSGTGQFSFYTGC